MSPERDVLGEIIQAAGRRPAPSAADYEEVLAVSRAAWQDKVHKTRRRRVSYALAASLAAALVVAASNLVLRPQQAIAVAMVLQGATEILTPDSELWRPLDRADALYPGTQIRTLEDGRVSLDLPLGTSLRVNANTRLSLASADRIALERGTVYLDSGPGVRTAQLVVDTAHGAVRDVGTQFEVASEAISLRVRVREGRIEIDQPSGSADLRADAGEELMLRGTGSIERRSIAPDAAAWAWTEALAPAQAIDGLSAYDVLIWVARETGRELRFADPTVERQARTAILRGNQQLSPAEALEVAAATSALNYEIVGGEILITRR